MRDGELFDGPPMTIGCRRCAIQRLPRKEKEELLAAVAVGAVARTSIGRQHRRHARQHLIAREVAAVVVVLLEDVDVRERHGIRVAITLDLRRQANEILVEAQSIAELRERVRSPLLMEPGVERFELSLLFRDLRVGRGHALRHREADTQELSIDRLGQEVIGARGHARNGGLLVRERGDEHEVDVRGAVPFANLATKMDAVHARHHPVRNHDARGVRLESGERLHAIRGGDHLVAERLHRLAKQQEAGGIVFGDEDAHQGPDCT